MKTNLPLAWDIIERVVGSWFAQIDHSTCGSIPAIADIDSELISAGIGVCTV